MTRGERRPGPRVTRSAVDQRGVIVASKPQAKFFLPVHPHKIDAPCAWADDPGNISRAVSGEAGRVSNPPIQSIYACAVPRRYRPRRRRCSIISPRRLGIGPVALQHLVVLFP
jgi:hypothetical protein